MTVARIAAPPQPRQTDAPFAVASTLILTLVLTTAGGAGVTAAPQDRAAQSESTSGRHRGEPVPARIRSVGPACADVRPPANRDRSRSIAAAALAAVCADSLDQHAQPDPAAAQEPAAREYPTLHFSGFGDFNFSATSRLEGPRGFSEGQFAAHLASELSPRVSFFGEVTLSARADAGTGTPPATGFNVEVERSIIRFDQSDALKVSFGRYHTPINWWNTAFHHGQWLQTTVTRPEMIQFGGRFLPVHFVGALVEGKVPAGGWHLNYNAGLGNGRSSVISRGGDAGDSNGSRAWLVNVFSKPDRPFGLQFGGSAYIDRVTLASRRTFDEQIVAAHVVWQKEDPELIAEVAAVRHQETGQSTSVWNRAFYIQAAYRLPWRDRRFKPYYRFERVNIAPADVVFAGVSELNASIVGSRWDVSQNAAFKAEYRALRRIDDTPIIHGAFLQIAFTF